MQMVKTEGLSFEYRAFDEKGELEYSHLAVDNVDLNVESGDFIAILGHNGSGKSTLAKHMNALLLPTNGTMYIKGLATSEEENLWQVRQTAGMVFQNPDNQIVATIVEEDVAFGPENLGVAPDEIRKRVDNSLETVEMTSYAGHSPYKLSGGQKQRIAIAGVLAMHPDCIILDEPTAMLDPSGRIEVMETVKRLNKEEGITIILITHYMDEAVQADKVFVMNEGHIYLQGTPRDIFSKVKEMKEIGLDVPQVTEIAYELREAGYDIDASVLTIEEMVRALCP